MNLVDALYFASVGIVASNASPTHADHKGILTTLVEQMAPGETRCSTHI